MNTKALVVAGAAVATVAVGGGAVTYAFSGTQSTTELDRYSAVSVDGHKALSGTVVAGRIQSKYHPLPWVGTAAKTVHCPVLPAAAGTTITCTGSSGHGKALSIPVNVVKVDATSVTWKFQR
ncbi:hypothetical protein OK074_3675 [Actinobacteria bacterium OK074]|nr:hypothetical protein OK074_3675 [Actinobacteria bacterium OK074]